MTLVRFESFALLGLGAGGRRGLVSLDPADNSRALAGRQRQALQGVCRIRGQRHLGQSGRSTLGLASAGRVRGQKRLGQIGGDTVLLDVFLDRNAVLAPFSAESGVHTLAVRDRETATVMAKLDGAVAGIRLEHGVPVGVPEEGVLFVQLLALGALDHGLIAANGPQVAVDVVSVILDDFIGKVALPAVQKIAVVCVTCR